MKKLLSLVLALALFVCAMPTIAFATDVTVYEDLSGVDGLEEMLVDPERNLAYGFSSSATRGEPGSMHLSYTDANFTDKALILNKASNLTNGNLDEDHTDVNTNYNGASAPLYVDSEGNAIEGVWLDITFSFQKAADIDAILLAGVNNNQPHFETQEYEIYMSDSVSNLYSESNKKYVYTNEFGSKGQYIEFSEVISAQYVGIRVTKALIPEDVPENHRVYGVPRIREVAVFGEITYTEADFIESTARANEYIAKLKGESHLNFGYVAAEGKAKGVIYPKGCDEGEIMGYGSIKSYTTENDLSDGDVSTFSDVSVYSPDDYMKYLKDGVFKENTYGDIIVCLENPSVVDSILIGQRSELKLRSRKYDIYISENLSDLFDEENRYAQYENKTGARHQTFAFEDGVFANYVGMRIYEPVTLPEYDLGDAVAYIRLAELAVFGTEKAASCNFSVSSTPIDIINANSSVKEGATISYPMPLTANGYTFSRCLVNGEEWEVEISPSDNSLVAHILIEEETEIVFEYAPDSAELSGNIFKISGDKVYVGRDVLVHELLHGFDQYRPLLSVTMGENEIAENLRAKMGMKLNLSSAGEIVRSYDIMQIGDPSNDGAVSVSDIVMSNAAALLGEEGESAILCDLDENGKVTVTDSVLMRNIALYGEDHVDYMEKTKTVSELDIKTIGRVAETSSGGILLDLPSTGFAVNLDCVGAVVANVVLPSGDGKVYTVVIDGEENEIITSASGSVGLTIAKNLERGEHEIAVYKNSGHTLSLEGLTFSGAALDAPEEKERYIEFIGDSITEGGGNMLDSAGVSQDGIRTRNEYMSYAAQAARLLDADWSNFCRGGAYLVPRDEATSSIHIPSVYAQKTINATEPYDFARKPDVVVINLGTNDGTTLLNKHSDIALRKAAFKEEVRKLAELVYEKNGADVEIVFAFGLMTIRNYMDEGYSEVAAELKAEGYSAHYVRLPTNKDGGGGHPDIAGAATGAEVLAEYIEENIF